MITIYSVFKLNIVLYRENITLINEFIILYFCLKIDFILEMQVIRLVALAFCYDLTSWFVYDRLCVYATLGDLLFTFLK